MPKVPYEEINNIKYCVYCGSPCHDGIDRGINPNGCDDLFAFCTCDVSKIAYRMRREILKLQIKLRRLGRSDRVIRKLSKIRTEADAKKLKNLYLVKK